MTPIRSWLASINLATRSAVAVTVCGVAATAVMAASPQPPSTMIHVSGKLRFGSQAAPMTNLYYREKVTDEGKVLALMFSNQPISVRVLDDRQKRLQLARKGEFLGLYAEMAKDGTIQESELYHSDGAFSGSWPSETPEGKSLPREGRIAMEEEREFFGQPYFVDVKFKIAAKASERWSGSPFHTTPPTGLSAGVADGWIERLGQRTKLTHAVAFVKTDLFGGGGERSVLLTNKPVTDDLLAAPRGPEHALREAGGAVLHVHLDEQGQVNCITTPTSDEQMMTFSSNQWELELAASAANAMDGTLESHGDLSPDSEHPGFKLRFHAPIKIEGPAAPVTAANGMPLPRDGGEPGKSYHAFMKALKTAKSIEELLPFRISKLAGDVNAVPVEQRPTMLKFLRAQAASPLKIVGGFGNESHATLWLEGKTDGEHMAGRVNVHRENGTWKLGAESYRIGTVERN